MSIETTVLLSKTDSVGAFKSSKEKGAGYHKYNNGVHTFNISFKNWSGELTIQGTLELHPSSDNTDWVTLQDLDGNPLVFGDLSSDYDDNYSVTSVGKFVWVRAVGTNTAGEITEIRYNC